MSRFDSDIMCIIEIHLTWDKKYTCLHILGLVTTGKQYMCIDGVWWYWHICKKYHV